MKRLLTILAFVLLMAGLRLECAAIDAFDASAAGSFAVTEEAVEADSASDDAVSIFLFTRSVKAAASEFLHHELGINTVHGQPLPGVLITLLLGAAFGLARKVRASRALSHNDENHAVDAFGITGRLLRMNISYLYPPETIHTISPGPDLFCQRE
jgi:hypothetical protein